MEKMKAFCDENNVLMGIITVPAKYAQDVCNEMIKCGIKAIWNFAHVDLDVPESVQVENVHLSDSLMKLSYNINRYMKEQEKEQN